MAMNSSPVAGPVSQAESPGLLRALQLSLFFRSRSLLHPEVNRPAPSPRPRGMFDQSRAKNFAWLDPRMARVKTGPLWSDLSAQVCEISEMALSAVVAVYRGGKILWLDNHADDADFEQFLRREPILGSLPDESARVLSLLCETKLNYLGWPQVIKSTADIPRLSEAQRKLMGDPVQLRAQLADEEALLASIAEQVEPPVITALEGGGFELGFCLWTKILGRVLRMQTSLKPDGSFRLEGSELAKLVGNGIVPR